MLLKDKSHYFFRSFLCKLRRNILYQSKPYIWMAHGFRWRIQCTIHLLQSLSSPGFLHPVNPRGLIESFGLGGGGGGGGQGVEQWCKCPDFWFLNVGRYGVHLASSPTPTTTLLLAIEESRKFFLYMCYRNMLRMQETAYMLHSTVFRICWGKYAPPQGKRALRTPPPPLSLRADTPLAIQNSKLLYHAPQVSIALPALLENNLTNYYEINLYISLIC